MVRAVLTTFEGAIDQMTFDSMDAMTDYLKEKHGKYEAVVAKVVRNVKELRQGLDDRAVTQP